MKAITMKGEHNMTKRGRCYGFTILLVFALILGGCGGNTASNKAANEKELSPFLRWTYDHPDAPPPPGLLTTAIFSINFSSPIIFEIVLAVVSHPPRLVANGKFAMYLP